MTLFKQSDSVGLSSRPNSIVVPGLVPLFSVTLFISAGLMFWVQPLFAKMALPFLGGAPAVWNTALMFFQATLLLGYGYAYIVSLKLPPRGQIITHLCVLAAAFVCLPVAIRGGYDAHHDPIIGLVVLLTVSIGLPFFAVSATAPMLQHWFAQSGHRHARDPYFLYGASNLGSILALLAFPFLMEPALTLQEQGIAWAGGYGALVLLIGLCAVVPAAKPRSYLLENSRARAAQIDIRSIWRQRLFWVLLAFAPSSLLLGVTQHITTDIAAAPLLWVIPLALYLLTFVIVFARRRVFPHGWVISLQPYLLVVALLFDLLWGGSIWSSVTLHLAVFFLLSLSCHGELVKRRPEAARLTEFYLCMSIGGLLGGAFNVLAAPLLFDGVYEYGLAIVGAAALRPGTWGGSSRKLLLDVGLPAILLMLALFIHQLDLSPALDNLAPYRRLALLVALAIVVFGFEERPLRYGLGVGMALLVYAGTLPNGDVVAQSRSFFGVYRVKISSDGLARQLHHGTTLHGAQLLAEDMAQEPVSYYSRQGPLGQAFEELRKERDGFNVAVVGLGVGSTLCYAKPGEHWVLFEIDPVVAEIAQDRRYFTFMHDCDVARSTELLIGDARLRLQELPDASFDLMVLDAYSSDAVPIHLMTREALALYREKLKRGGVLLFHISNRHLDLERVLSALVEEARVAALFLKHVPDHSSPQHVLASRWIAVAERTTDLSNLRTVGEWRELRAADIRPWTDDYSNIIDVIH